MKMKDEVLPRLNRDDSYQSKFKPRPKSKIIETYPYRDERGELLFEAVRFEPKGFMQRRSDGNGGWLYKLGDVRRVLYRLPELLASAKSGKPVFIVEGEKDVETLRENGFVSTCNPMGAGKWRDEYSEDLKGRSVFVFIADKDKHQEWAEACFGMWWRV